MNLLMRISELRSVYFTKITTNFNKFLLQSSRFCSQTHQNVFAISDILLMLGFEMRQIHQDPCVELLQDKINFGVFEAIKTIPTHPLSSTVQVLESLWVRLLLPV